MKADKLMDKLTEGALSTEVAAKRLHDLFNNPIVQEHFRRMEWMSRNPHILRMRYRTRSARFSDEPVMRIVEYFRYVRGRWRLWRGKPWCGE